MSSPKVIEYKIVYNTDVNRYLTNRWHLYGQPFINNHDNIWQAMVKYEEPIFHPLPINPPLPTGQPPHTRPLPLPPFPPLPTADDALAKEFASSILFKHDEIKQMQDAYNELIKVLEGKQNSSDYQRRKSVGIQNMTERLKRHLRGMGYEFSPVESRRNEEWVHMYLA
jgi:hypothetical protein